MNSCPGCLHCAIAVFLHYLPPAITREGFRINALKLLNGTLTWPGTTSRTITSLTFAGKDRILVTVSVDGGSYGSGLPRACGPGVGLLK